MTTILNDDGDKVTHINVTRVFTYNVEEIVNQLREDNRAGGEDDLEINLDDVLQWIEHQAEDDFNSPVTRLFFTDPEGNTY